MESNLLKEIKQLLETREGTGTNIPVPSYLFVQRYGRDILEEMQEIAAIFGNKSWFSFSTAGSKQEEKLLAGFQMELERNSGIGKEYTGSVLIEFSGQEEEKELEELLDYIDHHKTRLHCIYTIKAGEEVENIKLQLENYGFVRVVKGEEYRVCEQAEIFLNTVQMYQFQIEERAEEYIREFFEKRKWQEEDAVKIRIQNMAKEMVYRKLLQESLESKIITKADAETVISSLQSGKAKKRQIGFVRGGAEVE